MARSEDFISASPSSIPSSSARSCLLQHSLTCSVPPSKTFAAGSKAPCRHVSAFTALKMRMFYRSVTRTCAAATTQQQPSPTKDWKIPPRSGSTARPNACAKLSAQQTMLSKAPGAKFPARLPAPSTNGFKNVRSYKSWQHYAVVFKDSREGRENPGAALKRI